MFLQGLPVEYAVGLVLIPAEGTEFKRLLDLLPAAQLVPLISDVRFILPIGYLIVRLHDLAFDKPVAAGAPGGWAGGERRVVGVVLLQS